MSWAAETRGALVCSADTFRLAAVGVAYVLVFVFYFVFLYRRNPDAVFFFSKKTGTTIILLFLEIPLKSYNNLQLLLWTLLSSFVVCVVGLQQCVVFSCFPFFKCVRLRVRAQIPCVREHRRYVSRGEILVFLECVSPWEVWGGTPWLGEKRGEQRQRRETWMTCWCLMQVWSHCMRTRRLLLIRFSTNFLRFDFLLLHFSLIRTNRGHLWHTQLRSKFRSEPLVPFDI